MVFKPKFLTVVAASVVTISLNAPKVFADNLKGQDFSVISGSFTALTSDDPSSSGISAGEAPVQILFSAHQNEASDDADASQALHFKLEDDGSIEIDNYCKKSAVGSVYYDCLVFKFVRQGDSLLVTQSISADPDSLHDISSYFSTIDATKDIYLQIDTHAHESPVHVMAWNKATGPFEEQEAVFDSERDDVSSVFTFNQVGFNRLLTLTSASLFDATLSGPVFVHED